jgi:hypothetical protein
MDGALEARLRRLQDAGWTTERDGAYGALLKHERPGQENEYAGGASLEEAVERAEFIDSLHRRLLVAPDVPYDSGAPQPPARAPVSTGLEVDPK